MQSESRILGQLLTHAPQQAPALFDHLVSATKQR
jgi:hypothetical protein